MIIQQLLLRIYEKFNLKREQKQRGQKVVSHVGTSTRQLPVGRMGGEI